MNEPTSKSELPTFQKVLFGGLASALVLLARTRTLLSDERFEGIDGVALMVGLIIVFALSLFVLVGIKESDRFCLLMKGFGLPGSLLAGGELFSGG